MFAPIGYVNIAELLDGFRPRARGLTKAMSWVTVEQSENPDWHFNTHVEAVVVWMTCRVLDEVDTFICSPTGQVLRGAPLLFHHEDEPEKWRWINESLCRSGQQTVLEHYLNTERGNPLSRFRFLDPVAGVVCVEGRARELSNSSLGADENITTQTRAASQFDSWAVCFSLEDIPENWDILGWLDAKEAATDALDSDAKPELRRGRPRKVDKALAAYKGRFPKGHGALTWVEVASEISDLTGTRIHHETLMKAVNREKNGLNG